MELPSDTASALANRVIPSRGAPQRSKQSWVGIPAIQKAKRVCQASRSGNAAMELTSNATVSGLAPVKPIRTTLLIKRQRSAPGVHSGVPLPGWAA